MSGLSPGARVIIAAVSSIEQWWSQGERVEIALGEVDRTIFVRRIGAGPAMTLLHGFPSSSYDWARMVPSLASDHALLLVDFLGFGASEKPAAHEYSIHEQADLIESIWAREGIGSTVVVAHDYAVSVTQELLARRADQALSVELVGVHFLNGGLYPDLHRPQPSQTALLDAEQGPRISAGITAELWVEALKPTFAEGFDAAADCAEMWRAMSREDGQLIAHRLIRYLPDRAIHGERWVSALETTDVPLSFVWGMLDPVSGAHMARRVRERLPDAPFAGLDTVGHWPALEAPERVAAAIPAT
jgi:pimeloyl-ACP methyl ester carboxylesterase